MPDLMTLHADVLFTYDARGRMLTTNEPFAPARRPAPRVFAGRGAADRVLRISTTVHDLLARRVGSLDDAAIAAALAPTEAKSGPCYCFPDAIAAPSGVVALTRANRELARDTYPWLLAEVADWQPCFGVIEDGAVVSIAFAARISERVAEVGVDTLASHRGRGHASAVTLAWTAAIQASGRIPLYSTSADNLPSQAVARRCGLIQYGTDTTWT